MLTGIEHHAPEVQRTTMTLPKILGGAGALILSALVGGTLIGSAMATDETADPSTDATVDRTASCEIFRDTLASELGVTTDELVAAGKTAANAAIDAAVAAGDLDEDRAATMRERIDAFDGDCAGLGRGFGLGFGMGFDRGVDRGLHLGLHLQTAADALGMTPPELRDALADAGSLQAVADAQGVAYDTVKTAILGDVQARLDEAVADGLDQDRADTMLEKVTTWLDGGGQLDDLPGAGMGPGFGPGHGRGHGMGQGMGHGFGPWGGDDTDSGEEDAGA
jgi:hypothetical protein